MITPRWKIAVSIMILAAITLVVAWRKAMQAVNASTSVPVITYHYNNLRTGWNSNELTLTPSNVKSSFGLLHTVSLDEQVDAQPLVVPNQPITAGAHPGTYEVVYVATENNSIYAIDAANGTILLKRKLGAPVPKPFGCASSSDVVGINSTPVIDLTAKVMYVISYVAVVSGSTSVPTYFIHELNLSDLTDKVTAVKVVASHTLTNGKTYNFNATVQRQRPGLLQANGNIYAGFGSFCDLNQSLARGWVLGWRKGTLSPLNPVNKLTNTQVGPTSQYYLASVWMSGYGLASDSTGDIYFATGNSDPNHNVWDGVTDIQESVVRLSHSNLNTIVNIFTPTDEFIRDQHDSDLGAGGVLLLPAQPGSTPPLAVIAGKIGSNQTAFLYLLDRTTMTGKGKGILNQLNIAPCLCGQSYFNDGAPHVVTSVGRAVHLLNLHTGTSPTLTNVASALVSSGQDYGFFTSVSSSGSANAIIWAVARPNPTPKNPGTSIKLYAFNAKPSGTSLPLLFLDTNAGSWPHTGANANIVPVVANGHVFVASYKQLSIYGLGTGITGSAPRPIAANVSSDPSRHQIFGTITTMRGSQFTLQTRTGHSVQVDASAAIQNEMCIDLEAGETVDAQGTFDAAGVMLASLVQHAKESSELWPPDL